MSDTFTKNVLSKNLADDINDITVDLKPSKCGLAIVRDCLNAPKRIVLQHDVGMEVHHWDKKIDGSHTLPLTITPHDGVKGL